MFPVETVIIPRQYLYDHLLAWSFLAKLSSTAFPALTADAVPAAAPPPSTTTVSTGTAATKSGGEKIQSMPLATRSAAMDADTAAALRPKFV